VIGRRRELHAAIAAVGLAAGVAAFALTQARNHDELRAVGHPEEAGFVLAIGWSFIAGGLIAWGRRPRIWFGPLMIAVGFAWFVAALEAANDALPFSIGRAIAALWIGVFFHALLAFPTGRLDSRLARWLVGVYYLDVILVQFAWLVFADVRGEEGCSGCPDNLFLIADKPHLADAILIVHQPIIGFGVLAGGVLVLLLRWRRATPASRRALAPVFASGGLCLLVLALTVFVEPFSYEGGQIIGWASGFAFTAVPLAFLAGLARSRLDRIAVGDLVVELGEAPLPEQLRDGLARAIHDPSLEIAYFLKNGRWVDVEGRDTELPAPASGRSATLVRRAGLPVAALVHDSSVAEEGGLVEAVAAAAGLALENERLHADLRARLEDLAESRARIVETGDAERRRLERDLHDGAQQRFVAVAVRLESARRLVTASPAEAENALDVARTELREAIDELRGLARGIHPWTLSRRGLGAALRELARRSVIPLQVDIDSIPRLPSSVEAAAYFIAAEAVANATKHSHATHISISAHVEENALRLYIADDGIGGAKDISGSGIQGIRDRAEATGGRLTVTSPAGGPTVIEVRVPADVAGLAVSAPTSRE
jgi:signal transduction histidine kinase